MKGLTSSVFSVTVILFLCKQSPRRNNVSIQTYLFDLLNYGLVYLIGYNLASMCGWLYLWFLQFTFYTSE